MQNVIKIGLFFCLFPLLLYPVHVAAQQPEQTCLLRGRVWGSDTDRPLVNAAVSLEQSHIATVTNQDGSFSLRVPSSAQYSAIVIRHLGHDNKRIPVITLLDHPNDHIVLVPLPIELNELLVVSGDGSQLVRDALERIPDNYPSDPNMMVAFYRESIKKGTTYISLVEAVLDLYKASYRSYLNDQARIYIGRKATDITPRDTILMKFQGGITGAMMLDIAKNPDIVFGEDGSEYQFHIDGLININNKPHYLISFMPNEGIKDILFRGKIYLEASSLAFSRMEFNMNVENRKDAAAIFIKRKPLKMKVNVNEARYVVDFMEENGKWYFNYSATEVSFKVRWTNRFFGLFATTYTIGSELAVTDRYLEPVVKFPRKERIQSSDVIAERVEYFMDEHFWGDYNVIEPDQKISDAIKRLSGKLKRRKE